MIDQQYFEQLYAQTDPFGYRTRWYEERKRALLLASLGQRNYEHGWELGCSNGELSAALANRCRRLLATDLSERAVLLARRRLAAVPGFEVQCARHPGFRPDVRFDLIVCSELGYYLDPQQLPQLRDDIHSVLAGNGLLVACHWRVPFAEAGSDAESVHRELGLGLVEKFHYRDADFILQGWSADPQSVAMREGLR